MPDVAFLAVAALALPMLAALLPRLAAGLMSRARGGASWAGWQWLSPALWLVAAALAAASSFGRAEFSLGSWSPVSVTGAPLLFATQPGSGMLIAALLAALGLAQAARGRASFSDAVIVAATGMLALANNLPALLIGLGVLDLATAVTSLQHDQAAARPQQMFMNGASVVCMLVAAAVQLSVNNSAYFPLAQVSQQAATWWTAAVVIRAAWLAFSRVGGNAQWGVLGTLVLAAKLLAIGGPAMRGQWLVFFVLLGLVRLIAAWLGSDNGKRTGDHLVAGTAALALGAIALGSDALVLLSATAWCAGMTLLLPASFAIEGSTPAPSARLGAFISRSVGALALLGLPLLAGFSARAGALSALLTRTSVVALVILLAFAAQALLTAVVVRLVFAPGTPGPENVAPSGRATRLAVAASVLLLGLLLLALGIDPGLAGARPLGLALVAPGPLEWLVWIGGAAAGAGLWWFEGRVMGVADRLHLMRDARSLRARLARVIDLAWLPSVFAGAVSRLARPFGGVFPFLESDGALIWAIIAAVIALLATRPGTP